MNSFGHVLPRFDQQGLVRVRESLVGELMFNGVTLRKESGVESLL
jgi:hypothetical protein